MRHEAELLDLVDTIHAGAADPEAETAALVQLSNGLGGAAVLNILSPFHGGSNELCGAGLASPTGGVIRGPTHHVPYFPLLNALAPVRMVQPEQLGSQVAPSGEAFADSVMFRTIAPSGYRHLACGVARRTCELAQRLVLLRGPALLFKTDELQLTELLPPHFARAGLDEAAAVLVVVSDPARSRRGQAQMLEVLYALTPAQALVAASLAEGMSLPQVARELGISANTAKTHATRAFDKLGVEGQAHLVLKVASAVG